MLHLESQSNHVFDEVISAGTLTFQSQPKQKLRDPVIQDLINHNHMVGNIYLFLRDKKIDPMTRRAMPFTYLGRLAYVSHDVNFEQPVRFKWKLLDYAQNVPPQFETRENRTAVSQVVE